ncbi:MAG TPA: hypothetical protein VII72_17050 [Myxococcota bacterium]
MKEISTKVRAPIRLDWSRLLGFDQAPAPDSGSHPALRRIQLAKVGAKIGGKPGLKNIGIARLAAS